MYIVDSADHKLVMSHFFLTYVDMVLWTTISGDPGSGLTVLYEFCWCVI